MMFPIVVPENNGTRELESGEDRAFDWWTCDHRHPASVVLVAGELAFRLGTPGTTT